MASVRQAVPLRFFRSLNGWERYCLAFACRYYGTRQESRLWRQRPNKRPRLDIILTQDVHKLGLKRQIVKVKCGYGRNHLLPQGMAVYATQDNIKKLNAFEVKKGTSSRNEVEYLADFLSGRVLTVHHDPDSKSAVFEQHISRAFKQNFGIHMPLDCIELDEPIVDFEEPEKSSVTVRLDESTLVTMPVTVELKLSKKRNRKQLPQEKWKQIPSKEPNT